MTINKINNALDTIPSDNICLFLEGYFLITLPINMFPKLSKEYIVI